MISHTNVGIIFEPGTEPGFNLHDRPYFQNLQASYSQDEGESEGSSSEQQRPSSTKSSAVYRVLNGQLFIVDAGSPPTPA